MSSQCQVIISERGKVLLEINGFKFRKCRDLTTGETSWRCCKSTCSASMKTRSDDYTITDTKTMIHNHEPLTEKELARQRLSGAAKRKAKEQMSERPTKILQTLLNEQNCQVLETPDLSRIKRNMYNVRRKLQCQVIISERGKVLLEINRFKFRKSRDLETGETSWRCCKSTCGASMKTKSADYTITDTKMMIHNHEPLTEKELARQRLSGAAKRKAQEQISERPTKILQSLLNEQNCQVLETRDLSKIKRNMYNVRQKLQCHVIISEHGKVLLEINRYKFRKRRDLGTGETSWRCCKNTCGASMKTKSSDYTITDTKMMIHNHEPLTEKELARQQLSGTAKRKAQEQISKSPTKILQSLLNEQNCQVLESPDLSKIKRNICNVPQKLQCQVIISERGKVLLEINGFKFRKCRDLGTGETSWRCSNSTCGASMKTTSTDYTITETKMMIHSHEPLTEKQLARQRLSEAAKRKAKELMSEKPTKILQSLLNEQNCPVLESRDLSKIKRNMYNVRRKSQPKLPQSIEET